MVCRPLLSNEDCGHHPGVILQDMRSVSLVLVKSGQDETAGLCFGHRVSCFGDMGQGCIPCFWFSLEPVPPHIIQSGVAGVPLGIVTKQLGQYVEVGGDGQGLTSKDELPTQFNAMDDRPGTT
jgi:hypothetical protein